MALFNWLPRVIVKATIINLKAAEAYIEGKTGGYQIPFSEDWEIGGNVVHAWDDLVGLFD